MARTAKLHFMQFGPAMPIVAINNFSRIALTDQQWADAWSLCGPSAAKNMGGRKPLEFWQVIASAYLEGLQHGHALATEKRVER